MYSSAYHRISDDSVSSYGGHSTRYAATKEAMTNIKNPDIDKTWIRNPEGHVETEWSKCKCGGILATTHTAL